MCGLGSIIGKAGAKINEVRQASQCQIKINEPGEAAPGGSPLERVCLSHSFIEPCPKILMNSSDDVQLVTITGQPTGIQIAVRLLYQRLEQEKQKREFTLLLIGRIVSALMLIYRGSIGTELGA